jgi:hypothetical protein
MLFAADDGFAAALFAAEDEFAMAPFATAFPLFAVEDDLAMALAGFLISAAAAAAMEGARCGRQGRTKLIDPIFMEAPPDGEFPIFLSSPWKPAMGDRRPK